MSSSLLHLLFIFISINWFLIFTPIFNFFNFNWFLIWTCAISSLLLLNHPFIDGYYFGAIININTFSLFVLFIFTIIFIGYLYTLFNTSVSKFKELPLLFLIIYFGFTTLMVSNDLLILYLSIELFSLTFYLITTIHQNYYTTEAGIKYFIYNFIAGAFYLLGCTLIYFYFGTINFVNLIELTSLNTLFGDTGVASLGFIFIIISFLFKLSIAPFHFWTPDVYQGVLYPITAFFTIFPKFVVASFFLKFYTFILYFPSLNSFLIICGLFSIFIGAIGAFSQYNIKRLFAYSTILNGGFIITLISLGTPISTQSFFFYLITYMIANLGLFSILTNLKVSHLLGLKEITENSKILTLFLAIPVFSLAGLPPFVGFLAKFISIYLVFNNNLTFVAVFMLAFSIISLFYYLRFVHYLYFYNSPSNHKEEISFNIYQTYIIIISNFGLLFFSLNPSFLFLISSVLSSLNVSW